MFWKLRILHGICFCHMAFRYRTFYTVIQYKEAGTRTKIPVVFLILTAVCALAYTFFAVSAYHFFMEALDIKDAVVLRLRSICKERQIKINKLAVLAGVTPSTVYSLFDAKRREVEIHTLHNLCIGLDMTLSEFFDDEMFTRDILKLNEQSNSDQYPA